MSSAFRLGFISPSRPQFSGTRCFSQRSQARSPRTRSPKRQKEILAPAGPRDCDQVVFGLGLLSPPAEIAGEQQIGQDPIREAAIEEVSKPPPFLFCLSSWDQRSSSPRILGVHSQKTPLPEAKEDWSAQSLPQKIVVGSASCRSRIGTLCHLPSVVTGCFPPQGQLSSCQGPLGGRQDWVGKCMISAGSSSLASRARTPLNLSSTLTSPSVTSAAGRRLGTHP